MSYFSTIALCIFFFNSMNKTFIPVEKHLTVHCCQSQVFPSHYHSGNRFTPAIDRITSLIVSRVGTVMSSRAPGTHVVNG